MAREDEGGGERADRALRAAMAVISASLMVCAALAWWRGGFHLSLGPIDISVANPLRPVTQALAFLLLREAWGASAGFQDRLRFLGLFAALLACLACDSRPRIVGDGQEYVAMAWNLSMGRPPALSAEELRQAERSLLPPRVDGYRLVIPELQGADGLQDFYHFWAYSLSAAPFVRICAGSAFPFSPPSHS